MSKDQKSRFDEAGGNVCDLFLDPIDDPSAFYNTYVQSNVPNIASEAMSAARMGYTPLHASEPLQAVKCSHIAAEELKKLCSTMEAYEATTVYICQYTSDEQLGFVNAHPCIFERLHRSAPVPWICKLSVKGQRFYGDTVEECLDKAIKKFGS